MLASHSDTLIRRMCNRVILLDHGRVVADGPTEDILEIYSRMNKDEPLRGSPPPVEAEDSDQSVPAAATAI